MLSIVRVLSLLLAMHRYTREAAREANTNVYVTRAPRSV